MIKLKVKHLEEIKRIGEATYPHECCGVMVGAVEDDVKILTELFPAENRRTDSLQNRYLITSDFLLEVEKRLKITGGKVIGFFHSHPDVPAHPSSYDLEHAWPWYSYLIVSVRQGKAAEVYNWELSSDRLSFQQEELRILPDC